MVPPNQPRRNGDGSDPRRTLQRHQRPHPADNGRGCHKGWQNPPRNAAHIKQRRAHRDTITSRAAVTARGDEGDVMVCVVVFFKHLRGEGAEQAMRGGSCVGRRLRRQQPLDANRVAKKESRQVFEHCRALIRLTPLFHRRGLCAPPLELIPRRCYT